jgi:hypothetical protein
MAYRSRTTDESPAGCSKRPDFSPAQPRRLFHPPALNLPRQTLCPGTHLVPSKAAASCHFIRGGWDDPNCARRFHPPDPPIASQSISRDVPFARAKAFPFPIPPLGEGPRLPSTARIERAQSHRARSASKEGTWPLPIHPSEAARCASKGIVPATPSPLFSILLGLQDR